MTGNYLIARSHCDQETPEVGYVQRNNKGISALLTVDMMFPMTCQQCIRRFPKTSWKE